MTDRIPPPIVMTSYQKAEKMEAIDAEGEFWIRDHERNIWMSFIAEDDKKMPIAEDDPASKDASRYETSENLNKLPGRIYEQLDTEPELDTHEGPISLLSIDRETLMEPLMIKTCQVKECDIGCNTTQDTHIPDPALENEPASLEETQNINMGSIYDKEIFDKNSFISITDANDSTGSELLRNGWECYGHGGWGDLIPSSFYPPPPLATPGEYPKCDTLAEYSLLRTPSVLILQLSSRARLRTYLNIIQPGMFPIVTILVQTSEVNIEGGVLKEVATAVTNSGPGMHMRSMTLTHRETGCAHTGAWTIIYVWTGHLSDFQLPVQKTKPIPRHIRDILGDDFGKEVEYDVLESWEYWDHQGVLVYKPRVRKTARVRINGKWVSVYHDLGRTPAVNWLDSPPLIFANEVVTLTVSEISRLLHISGSPLSSEKQLWMALPGGTASRVAEVLEPMVKSLKIRRRRTDLPPQPAPKVGSLIRRAPLNGGRLWCIDSNCTTCKKLEKPVIISKRTTSV